MDESFLAVPIIGIIFIGLPWVVLHYLTKMEDRLQPDPRG
jgi:hypothetical protein